MKDQLLREAPLNLKPKVKIGLCVSDGWSLVKFVGRRFLPGFFWMSEENLDQQFLPGF